MNSTDTVGQKLEICLPSTPESEKHQIITQTMWCMTTFHQDKKLRDHCTDHKGSITLLATPKFFHTREHKQQSTPSRTTKHLNKWCREPRARTNYTPIISEKSTCRWLGLSVFYKEGVTTERGWSWTVTEEKILISCLRRLYIHQKGSLWTLTRGRWWKTTKLFVLGMLSKISCLNMFPPATAQGTHTSSTFQWASTASAG